MLEAIRSAAPISRAEISRRVGISKPTVSQALQSLLDAGLVRETAHDGDGPSYGATFFEPVPEAAFVLGLDLGARFVRGAVCDVARRDPRAAGRRAARRRRRRRARRDRRARARADRGRGRPADRVDGVVLGVPGAVDARRDASRSPRTSRASRATAFARRARATRLGMPVTLENDINLAALGERWRGVARGVDDFAFLSIGTGLGAGLVLRGELHRGHHGAAGELDYVARRPGRGHRPVRGRGLGRSRRSRRRDRRAAYDPRAIFAAARAGDALAREVVDEEARRIALHIVPIAAVTDVGARRARRRHRRERRPALRPIRAPARGVASVTRRASRPRASATPPC